MSVTCCKTMFNEFNSIQTVTVRQKFCRRTLWASNDFSSFFFIKIHPVYLYLSGFFFILFHSTCNSPRPLNLVFCHILSVCLSLSLSSFFFILHAINSLRPLNSLVFCHVLSLFLCLSVCLCLCLSLSAVGVRVCVCMCVRVCVCVSVCV